ncbi:hypothetical protein A2348_05540 [Candidatus Uhrbacteria bacterium RIFOXYB12_FULL_58_10]|uniref:DHFR domain-containing protein n=1 Tax=Candidatus Uhrbacteria bacterium RIFOXYB2_FULL_57_15 TaxID=1802422 RepID=A0A1F7W9K5_9BACT|nr:MAG: hypothetical protein A2348_05540 [Candidatus Uhrbacteria bacterium RIFOXYB12_FULL_58_10]OGL98877.1 MAG: hypothetical protein A2304_03955 [Candidatus Uhrbacteria bacterium RIFOXYB2_FULL_57_15]OGL99530.1 MAG: hypothetical protein A2501_04160 [Candidatus Uhrbacteria bacterium RIFOXYC12_FULL_57_11]
MIVSLIAAVSADGKIAQSAEQSSLDWTSREDTRFFISKTKEIGTVVMGRKTFGTIGKPLKDRRTIVMSSRTGIEGVEWTSEPPADLVARLEREGVTRMALCGGAAIYDAFLSVGLVDELFLTVEPVLFGDGVPLFRNGARINLKLLETTKLGDSSVLLHYLLLK